MEKKRKIMQVDNVGAREGDNCDYDADDQLLVSV